MSLFISGLGNSLESHQFFWIVLMKIHVSVVLHIDPEPVLFGPLSQCSIEDMMLIQVERVAGVVAALLK
ncbi:MAG: hypothetical protein LKF48_07455 [Prevotella sp.]|nr:hypothetical protein [Prevotella sp.]MCH4182975.1 hypothetical protein [Prevotella sp.]